MILEERTDNPDGIAEIASIDDYGSSSHMLELQSTIISGLVSTWNDPTALAARMHEALAKIDNEYMEGDLLPLWRIITRYYPLANALPSPRALDEMMESSTKLQISEKVRLSQKYKEMSEADTSLAQYRLAIVRIAERWRDTQYARVLSDATRIHLGSLTVDKQVYSGYSDSVEYLRKKSAELERLVHSEETSEGDINTEVAEFLQMYVDAKQGTTTGVLTGFADLDTVTRGLHPGELWLLCAYTAEGKSKMAYNIAYHAAYIQGKNVLFGTNEATREQVRRNIIVRHSHNPKFQHSRGLRYSDVKFGTLSLEDEQVLKAVLQDMRSNRENGKMFVYQVPRKASMDYVADIIHRQQRLYPIHLSVVDYLGLMTSARRAQRREELDDVIIQAKRIAVDQGVAILSPWQITREAWLNAQKTKLYTKASLSDTSQSEKSTDVAVSILKMDEGGIIKCQILKNRDGSADVEFELETDFTTSLITPRRTHANLLDV